MVGNNHKSLKLLAVISCVMNSLCAETLQELPVREGIHTNIPQRLLYEGMLFIEHYQMNTAKNKLNEAHLLFQKIKDEGNTQQCILYLGIIDAYRGRIEDAHSKISKAAGFFESKNDFLNAAKAFYYLGQISIQKCEFPAAKAALRKAIVFYKKTPHAYEAAKCLLLLGQTDLLRSKWHRAKDRFLEAIFIAQSQNLKRILAQAFWGLGEIDRSLYHYTKATFNFERA